MGNTELRSELMRSSISERTKVNYQRNLKQFTEWCQSHNIESADDRVVSEFLTALFAKGYAPGTIKLFSDAIIYDARQRDVTSPVGNQSRSVLAGIAREGRDRGRGQSEGLTFEQYHQILDKACEPRSEYESIEQALERGREDRAMVTLLFMGAMRRSEVARAVWQDIDFTHDDYVFVSVPHSKTNQQGEREDVRVLSKRGAQSLRDLRTAREHEPQTHRVIPVTDMTINIRFKKCCSSIGLKGRYTSHSGRIGLASELCARGAPIQAVALAGGWQSADMVIHYSKKAERERGAVATYL